MMLSPACFSRIYCIIAKKEIKMLELETLFMLVNDNLYEYGLRFCLYEHGPPKWVKPHVKLFLRKSLNFKIKIAYF